MLTWFRSILERKQESEYIHNIHDNDNLEKLRELTIKFNDHAEIVTSVYRALLHSHDACYIADIETHEILWVNNAIIELYGKGLVGQKCYNAFQGFDSPCSFCTNKKIEYNNTYTWVFFNEKLQRRFLIRDRAIEWGNKTVRLETAIDITGMDINYGAKY